MTKKKLVLSEKTIVINKTKNYFYNDETIDSLNRNIKQNTLRYR